MTTIARTIASTPARSASETWSVIAGIVSNPGDGARVLLDELRGIAASVIADEAPREAPIVVAGCGPRLRIYCVYGEDAITGEGCDENPLSWNPTEKDWEMYLPCPTEDLDWIRRELKKRSANIFAYDADKGLPDIEAGTTLGSAGAKLSVNLEGFLRK